jgi:K+/H+ antiporter YhaU regulatory subunit KhtT
MVAEGVHAFRVKTPSKLHGSRLAESRIHEHTGCLLIGVQDGGSTHINPGPQHVFEPGHELILVGSIEAEERFLTVYPGALIGARGSSVLPTGAAAAHS